MTLAYPYTTGAGVYLCVCACMRVCGRKSDRERCCCLPLEVSVHIYLYHSTECFRPQHPHRRDLKPGITDDIIKLLNETAAPVEEGAL